MSKKPPHEKITLTFDLFDLPTAQHRAGLAGLILQIDAMGQDGYRKNSKLVPVIEDLTPTSATISFTSDSMQGVFDELYEAKLVEVVVAAKWPGETKPKPGDYFIQKKDPKTGELKQAPGFAYDVVQPQAPCLKRHLEGQGDAWLELWRQMVWSIPRGGNNVRSRAPFIDRANHQPCGDGATIWTEVVEFQDRRAKSEFMTRPISGALMLGAQAVNAEAVSFAGRVDHNLLLHFWQLVVLTFVPQVVSKKDAKVERVGYVLAIPDVADLVEFRHVFPAILQGLEAKDPKHTPDGARLDLPDQACLEVLRRLSEGRKGGEGPADREGSRSADDSATEHGQRTTSEVRSRRHAGIGRIDRPGARQALATETAAEKWGDCIRAVESYHMFKLGNNVKILSIARVADRPGLVDDYQRIKKSFRNPLFRAARMRAILQGQPWHWGMIELFAEYPYHFFLEIEGETPEYLPHFGRDAKALFAAHQQEIRGMTPNEMNEDETIKRLGIIVRNLVTSYVNRKAAKKLGLDWDDFKVAEGKKYKVPPEGREEDYVKQQRRVCDDAFLQVRSRHDEEFVSFFADSICSVPHSYNSKAGDLPFLMQILMTPPTRDPVAQPVRNRDDIKTLAMLALSAYSFNVRESTTNQEVSPS
jgi:hypothetical protein